MTERYIAKGDEVFDIFDPYEEPMSTDDICNFLNRWYHIAMVSTNWLMSDECNLTDKQIHRLRKELGYD